jgi:peptidoglycan/LPS O-acetylase OafA/YrhL
VVQFSFLEGWGANGVDIFFVISGFVMVYTQLKNPKSFFIFIKNRFIRIIPIYWVLTGVLMCMYLLVPSLIRHNAPSMAHVISSYLFVSQTFVKSFPLLYVGWSLEYEMLFYLLFAIGLFVGKGRISFLLSVLVLLILVVIRLTDVMVIEFVFGMVCALLYFEGKRSYGLLSLIIGAILLAVTIFYQIRANRVIIWGFPALLVVYGAVNIRQFNNKVFVFLGGASYSIYLVQVFTIPAFYKFSSRYLTFVHADIIGIVALAATGIAGAIVYQYIEKPLGLYLKRVL